MSNAWKAVVLQCAVSWTALGVSACSSDSESKATVTPKPQSLEVVFVPGAGTFTDQQLVTLSVENDKASIHYTVDGSLPTANSPAYAEPLLVTKSTRVRALAIVEEPTALNNIGGSGSGGNGNSNAAGSLSKAGALGTAGGSGAGGSGPAAPSRGPMASHLYLRVAADAASFTSHLPLILIDTFESGRLDPDGDTFMSAGMLIFEPTAGRAATLGTASLDARIGIHVRGESSRDFKKKQYAVEIWQADQDEDMDLAVLGLPKDSDWVISDAIAFDRTLIHNALAFELSNRIGRYAPRTRFAEVFLIDDGGDLRMQNFLGFYTLIEKIKRGSERVSVQKLSEEDLTDPAVTGGYILQIDKGDSDFQAVGKAFQFVYPDNDLMHQAARQPQLNYIKQYVSDFGLAVNATDFKHPTTHQPYSDWIDVPAWIDHDILNALTKNVDALRISAYFSKDRQGKLAAGPLWDFDRSLGTPYDPRATQPEEWKQSGSDGTDYFKEGFWARLFADESFKSQYRTRFLALLAGELSAANTTALVDQMAAQIGDAAARNFQRWPDSPPRDGSYAAEIKILKDFLTRRSAWIQQQLNSNF